MTMVSSMELLWTLKLFFSSAVQPFPEMNFRLCRPRGIISFLEKLLFD